MSQDLFYFFLFLLVINSSILVIQLRLKKIQFRLRGKSYAKIYEDLVIVGRINVENVE